MIRNRIAITALLTGLNFLNYVDRYLVAAVLPRIKADLGLTNTEGGLLATIFLLGYFVTAPIFGALGDRMSRKVLIALGVVVWSAATIASGLAGSVYTLIAARAVVGIGEASYATLAPTIIDDITPPEHKGKTLAIFFVAVPLGSATGYLLGGYLQQVWGWREAFFVGGGPGLVLAGTCLLIAEPPRKLAAAAKVKIVESIRTLYRIVLYRRAVLGYCAHTASVGAFAYWAPTFLAERFQTALSPAGWADAAARAHATLVAWWAAPSAALSARYAADAAIVVEGGEKILKSSNFYFGIVTVVAGALGTFLGGRMADRALAGLPPVPEDASHLDRRNRAAANAQLKVCAIGVAIAFPLAALAFVAPAPWMFFAIAGLAEVGLFMSTAPINAIMLRTSPAYLRASAMAVGIFSIHLFGDLWSPTVVGSLLDVLVPALAMMALPLGFAIATAVWWPRPHEAAAGRPDAA